MGIIIGTCHFVSFEKACLYYSAYERFDLKATVKSKIEQNEIVIGKPELKAGQKLLIVDNGTRYAIEDLTDNEILGQKIVDLLGLKPIRSGEQKGRYNTSFGNKTLEGLGATIKRLTKEEGSDNETTN